MEMHYKKAQEIASFFQAKENVIKSLHSMVEEKTTKHEKTLWNKDKI